MRPQYRAEIGINADPQRSTRELDGERYESVYIALAMSREFQRREYLVDILQSGRARKHEIRIQRLVLTAGIVIGTGAACQNGANTRAPEGIANGEGDIREGRAVCDLQNDFPVLRGRRRRLDARVRRSSSDSSRRAR